MVEFLNYWEKNNYGYMANCYAPMLEMKPVIVREEFEHRTLVQYELLEIAEVTSAVADAKVKVKLKKNGGEVDSILEFRIVCNTKDGNIAYIQTDETIWGITTWRLVE